MDGAQVSVVIPVHNRRRLVRRALRSVLRQQVPPREVIVVDDGSDDGSADAAQAEAESLKAEVQTAGVTVATAAGSTVTVRIIRNARNRGVSAARNMGAAMAAGAWVAFLDSDDEWLPHKLGSAAMVRRDVLRGCGGFDRDLPVCEDYDLWLRLCARHPVLCVPQELLVKHGGHAGQLSRRHWGMDRFRVHALEKILHSGALGEGDYAAARDTLLAKLQILSNGALKHDNKEVHDTFAPRLAHWRETANGAARTAH